MTKTKKLLTVCSLLCALLGCFAFTACADNDKKEEGSDEIVNPGDDIADDGSDGEEEEDEESSIIWDYQVWNYETADGSAATLDYAVYVPDSYSESGTALPLITYIPDSGYTTRTIQDVTAGECPRYWVSEEKMESNPAIFLVLTFTKTGQQGGAVSGLSDAREEYSQAAQVDKIVDYLCENYNIDTDRLYLTGQSMGGIFDWSLNTLYPDKYAATVYVGCQPGDEVDDDMYVSLLAAKAFVNQKFIYIASRLDPKASVGQDAVEQVLIAEGKSEGTDYIKYYSFDKSDAAGNSAAFNDLIDENIGQYFLGFPYVVSEAGGTSEHLRSFLPSYAIDAVYEWLLAQTNA